MKVQKCSNILDDYISIGLVLLHPLIKLQSLDEKYLLIESQSLAGVQSGLNINTLHKSTICSLGRSKVNTPPKEFEIFFLYLLLCYLIFIHHPTTETRLVFFTFQYALHHYHTLNQELLK